MEDWIQKTLDAVTRGYARMINKEIQGIQPINRPESLGRNARRLKRLTGKSSWFKKKGQNQQGPQPTNRGRTKQKGPPRQQEALETVLFIPHTPHSELKNLLQEAEDSHNKYAFGWVKFIETVGPKLTEQLSNTAPWRTEKCERHSCPPCKTNPGDCRKRNLTYTIECNIFHFLYRGESHRTSMTGAWSMQMI